ncbi:MAG: hypothetical protein H6897_02270 [Rhodobacteraceae bacterium]|uniref:AsmA-like C-terminal region-containing protein n=1 Tax=Albidovulum sp. TaxID=1872424 RepID=UPI001D98D616|nr:AsmA-like C-terminal region-containing protein [uncultured Defluviimonas sp.]MCB2124520.1 hypothetical protein [Paracoccaceae bacterium]MCC0068737.1 hypothetical protein [Paracoccaceae bacterium]
MSESEDRAGEAVVAPQHVRHPGLWFGVALVALLILVNIALGLTGKVIPAPRWVVERVEARANASLGGVASARVGGVDLVVDRAFVPHVRLRAVELLAPGGRRIAVLPDLRTTLKAQPILRGKLEPRSLSITGAKIALRRLADGSLDVAVGQEGVGASTSLEPAEIVGVIDRAFEAPVLNGIETITVDGLDLTLRDDRSDKVWAAADGWLTLTQDKRDLSIDLGFALEEAGQPRGRAQIAFASVKGSTEATVSMRVTDVSARDLAAQSPALAWLGALDAPISGALQSGISADGAYAALDGSLEIGAGALQPTPGTKPVRFDRARFELSYDPAAAALRFSDIVVDGPALKVRASAKAWLKDFAGAFPTALVGQIAITDLQADPEGVFADAVAFNQGALDFRLALDPFRLDLGQLVLVDGDQRITARGQFAAAPAGWAASLDAGMDAITSDRLLALWPVAAVPKTRAWLQENVATSELFDVNAAFRLSPGAEPHFHLGWEFRDTEVRVIRTLPPIEDGAGYATIDNYTYTLVVDRGHVTPPEGGIIDVAGSVMSIPDLRIKPAPARFTLKTESTITAALALLDEKPFEFMKKAGRPVDVAEGRARAVTLLDLTLAPKITPQDVGYQVTAELFDVTSDRIAPGREFTAGRLQLRADREGLEIWGPAMLSGVPMDVRWRQGFAPADKGRSRAEGTMELSPRALEAFSVALPKGSVAGKGKGMFTLDLAADAPPAFRLTSDLSGLALRIPEIGWTKPPATTGDFTVEGALDKPARIDRLALSAAGLEAQGALTLTPDGGLDSIRLERAKVGGWFEGQVELKGQGKGRPLAISVTGGQVDLRSATFGTGEGAAGGGPLTVALDRVRVTEGIALTGFRGTFTTKGGLNGEFAGRVNGEAPVQGAVVPMSGRTAVRVRSDDAGQTFRAAGVFTRGVGGRLDLTLRPSGPARDYDGTLTIRQFRVTGVPALAELLDAISVVGLLAQLNGPGLLFSDVSGDFRLTPDAVEIRDGSAIGPSLGISGAGTYRADGAVLDLQGTISPIYMLNGIGQIFSKRREGLFGFNYRMTGPAADPRVAVNPLSILTPGMFRDIFRAAPPKLDQ